MGGEVFEVLGRRPTPLVDGLIGVTNRSDREAVTEQDAEQLSLCGVGVLIFVEQRDRVAGPDPAHQARVPDEETMSEQNQVAVVQDAEISLEV